MTAKKKKKTSVDSKKLLSLGLIVLLIVLVGISAYTFFGLTKKGKTYIKESDGRYELIVDGKPFLVKGVCYNPVPPGESHLYNWWGDSRKPWMTDGKMMKELGVNTIRVYEPGGDPAQVKKVISDLYENFGIRTIIGHGLGFWDFPHANYADPQTQMRIKKDVYRMVKEYKNEPGVLTWVLGNEANYSFDGSVNAWSTPSLDEITNPYDRKVAKAKIYYTFVNELANVVKKVDPNRPVGFGNGELGTIEVAKDCCPDLDYVGIIIYRGKSFGSVFRQLREKFAKPCIMIEFGCDSYNAATQLPDQENQALFIKQLWTELYDNTAYGANEKNCLGGTVFEWNDEWWKYEQDNPQHWKVHNTEASWSNGSYYYDIQTAGGMNMNEEWFGIVSYSDEIDERALNKRAPKKVFNLLKEMWN